MKLNIALLPGDGIGPEVTLEARKVLEAVAKKFNHTFTFSEGLIGADAIRKKYHPFPNETKQLCRETDAILFGAVGDPKFDSDPKAKTRPEQGLLGIRKFLKLFNNIRPIIVFDELLDMSPVKKEIVQHTNFVIVRELSGGLYYGQPQGRSETGDTAYDTCIYSKKEIKQTVTYAFSIANKRRRLLTLVDKANVLASSRLWREVTQKVAEEFPAVKVNFLYIDNAAMQIIINPNQFDVIVTENMFGDILTDEASVLSGSLGILPSSSIGPDACLYEPIHGSYPQAAGKNIANPIGAILSTEMMLSYSFNLQEEANAIREAVKASFREKKMTEDIKKTSPSKTSEVGSFVAEHIMNC